MKLFKFKSIYTKFVVTIVLIMVISSFLSLTIVSSMIIYMLHTPMVDMMKDKAAEIDRLYWEYNIPPDELVKLADTGYLTIEFYEDEALLLESVPEITPEMLDDTENSMDGLLVSSKNMKSDRPPYLISDVADRWVLIKLEIDGDMFRYIAMSLRSVLAISVLLSIGIVLIAVKRIVRPMKRLTAATQKVAVGDFDVRVEYDGVDEMGALVKNFNTMAQELRNIEYLRKDFVSSVSHEFKTPIASIGGFAKILRNDSLEPSAVKEYADIIVSETDRLSKLSSNLLRLSSLENQSIVDRVHAFSLDEQIRRVLVLLEHKWSEKHLELEVALDPVTFNGDEELLQQVWINLIDNAIKFSHESGQLTVKASTVDGEVIVRISDSGDGMDGDTLNRIFEKFYQGDSAHATEGNGLGLSIAKRIIDLHDGMITVNSGVGTGTEFEVRL
ncbi:MAG: HAMP domain-containing histidine kinase [Clostridia bacterium]|nr:HAMP domain-containing histidine kinase [Clostridia bacterium]